jgi:signal transduction histidine kinase
LKQHISAAGEHVADIAKDIQALSHRLHSPKLELLGLAAAASSFCKEFSHGQNVEVDFEPANIPRNLPDDISLTLYRVLQEALRNAVKHSGSRHFRVSLTGEANEIELAVQDSGVGFEPDEAIKGRGLGLASMKERMKLVDGELSIDSQLQQGTTIRARVPFDPKSKAAGASGSK